MKNLPVILLLALFALGGCKKETADPVDLGYAYFPTQNGHWVSYNVDSIVYDAFNNSIDTFNYQIKEVIAGQTTDAEGRRNQRIERMIRQNASQQWQLKDVWTQILTDNTAEKVEENQRYIKLTFPIREGNTWQGNAYVSDENVFSPEFADLGCEQYKDWEYEYTGVDVNVSSGWTFPVVVISHTNCENAIAKDHAGEMYGKGIGMVWRQVEMYRGSFVGGQEDIDEGFKVTYTYMVHGK